MLKECRFLAEGVRDNGMPRRSGRHDSLSKRGER